MTQPTFPFTSNYSPFSGRYLWKPLLLKFSGRVEGRDNDGGWRRAGEAAVLGEDGLLVREEDQVVRSQGFILHVSSSVDQCGPG